MPGHRQVVYIAHHKPMPTVKISDRTVERRVAIAKVSEKGPKLAILRWIQFICALRSTYVINSLRPGVGALEKEALLKVVGKSQLSGVIDGKTDVSVNASSVNGRKSQCSNAQGLVIDGVGVNAITLAIDISNRDWIGRASQRRQERSKYPKSAEIVGSYITGFQNPRPSQIPLDREVPLLSIGNLRMNGNSCKRR